MKDENPALEASLRYMAAGFSVLPIVADGTKAPALSEWKDYQVIPSTVQDIRRWHRTPGQGCGLVCGPASLNLAVIDFEYLDYFDLWAAFLERIAPGLLARLPSVLTPGKDEGRGRHVYVRCVEPIAGGVFVRMSPEEALRRTGKANSTTAIEIRGDGSQVLAPGCPAACHPSGRLYELLPGPAIEDTPTLSVEEFKPLKTALRMLAEMTENAARKADSQPLRADGGRRPGDEYNERADWSEILTNHGWSLLRTTTAGVSHWTRPGKDTGTSATTGFCSSSVGGDLLFVFSTNASPLEQRAYSKFSAFAALEHGGDTSAAAKDLSRQGYGDPGAIVSVTVEDGDGDSDGDEIIEDAQEPEVCGWPAFVLPAALEAYAAELAAAMSCPIDFPAAAMLTIAGAAIGGSRALEIRRTWRESGRIWLATVGAPGTGKSPALEQLMNPVEERQNEIHTIWQANREQYELDAIQYEVDCKAYTRRKSERKDHKDDSGPPDEPPIKPHPPHYQHLYTDNATTEALVPMLAENARGFLVSMDELPAWINSMNQYKGGKGADRQFWLSAWNGKTVKVDRKSSRDQGSIIAKKPFMCIVGGIQPDKLAGLADSRGHDDGLVDRLLFVYPPKSAWSERIGEPPSEGGETAWVNALNEMWSWEMNENATDGTLDPVLLRLTAGGREVSDAWYAAHAREVNDPTFPLHLYGPWSKLRAYYFRFCLILQCLRLVCGEECGHDVDADTAERAAALVAYLKTHLRRVHSRVSFRPDDVLAEKAVAWIKDHGGRAKPRDLVSARIVKKASEALVLLKDLADRGLGVLSQPKTTSAGRQPGYVFEIAAFMPRISAAIQRNSESDVSRSHESG